MINTNLDIEAIKKALEEYQQELNKNTSGLAVGLRPSYPYYPRGETCPSCGYCPHCGRGGPYTQPTITW